jgi:hypothetical protein
MEEIMVGCSRTCKRPRCARFALALEGSKLKVQGSAGRIEKSSILNL